ncbi:MAG: type I DNA topoisomerase [Desulfobacterota bacterium]|nr:type I DNA topoisomerase [Thermodesulfobacteriota bacterium]MDW8002409.1 type I DNA topoisomerase [Deltaproteobacteria bacterium]
MGKSLLIVESPTKVKTLAKFLDSNYIIKATYGHIKDLPEDRLGVDIKNGFTPEFVVIKGKSKIVEDIKKSSREADRVLIGSDPDREGEAIAFHVAELLDGHKEIKRVLFHEITKKGIEKGLRSITDLNENKYNAQKARRILDRLVGYQISPILWEKVSHRLSAGRVQSAALRMICDREEEIEKFVKEEYWKINVVLELDSGTQFEASLASIDGEKAKIQKEEEAQKIKKELESLSFEIKSVTKKKREIAPQPPFITSRMQQEASKVLKFSPKKTMLLAQILYEGVELEEGKVTGLITYMRTDSVRISEEAREDAKKLIYELFGSEYLPSSPRIFKNKSTAQDAHEAIRPTDVWRTPESVKPYLTRDLYLLYDLIWKRFVASQMAEKIVDSRTVEIIAGKYTFVAKGERVIFDGFSKLYEEAQEAEEERHILPDVDKDKRVRLKEVKLEKKYTTPPPRFTEASLIKALETNGIGRPSTYATILSTILERGYAKKEEGKLKPTPLGRTVNSLLKQFFPLVVDLDFTAKMEERLDQIENGKANWSKILEKFYLVFDEELKKAKEEMRNLKKEERLTEIVCDRCGKPMVLRWSKNGEYIYCSDKENCKNRKNVVVTEDGKIKIIEEERKGSCPRCGGALVEKIGKYGKFIACSAYPLCTYTEPYSTGLSCPILECNGKLVEKRSKKKKRPYVACSNYPKCSFITNLEPEKGPCPLCGCPTLFIKKGKKVCLREGCNWQSES